MEAHQDQAFCEVHAHEVVVPSCPEDSSESWIKACQPA